MATLPIMSTVGQAKITFEADTGKVSDQLQTALDKAMARVEQILTSRGQKAGDGLADSLEGGAQRAGKAVDGIDASGLSKVQDAAAKAGLR